jgi:hypothetical protein
MISNILPAIIEVSDINYTEYFLGFAIAPFVIDIGVAYVFFDFEFIEATVSGSIKSDGDNIDSRSEFDIFTNKRSVKIDYFGTYSMTL